MTKVLKGDGYNWKMVILPRWKRRKPRDALAHDFSRVLSMGMTLFFGLQSGVFNLVRGCKAFTYNPNLFLPA